MPYVLDYPADIIRDDMAFAQITINDRGEQGALSSIPEPWILLSDNRNAAVYQALLYHRATGLERGTTAAFSWTSADGDNDCIVGRIHLFRYVDWDQPFESLTGAINGNLSSIDLPTVTTTQANSLALYFVSWGDNVSTSGPTGETGGEWANIGNIFSTSIADGAANRRGAAVMADPGTISGGSIATTPTP